MTDNATPIRKRVWDGDKASVKDVGEQSRDLDGALQRAGTQQQFVVTGFYTEPMYLALTSKPYAIVASQIRFAQNQEKVVGTGNNVEWAWDGTNNRAKITNIDGMSVWINPGVQFIFSFLVIG